jgi:hypothetical protein
MGEKPDSQCDQIKLWESPTIVFLVHGCQTRSSIERMRADKEICKNTPWRGRETNHHHFFLTALISLL